MNLQGARLLIWPKKNMEETVKALIAAALFCFSTGDAYAQQPGYGQQPGYAQPPGYGQAPQSSYPQQPAYGQPAARPGQQAGGTCSSHAAACNQICDQRERRAPQCHGTCSNKL